MLPCITTKPELLTNKIKFTLVEKDLEIQLDSKHLKPLYQLLLSLDGTKNFQALAQEHNVLNEDQIVKLIQDLDNYGVIDDYSIKKGRSGIDVLFELEDLTNRLLYKTLYKNKFWEACQNAETINDIPINVMRGLVVENYHFLFRESYFDAPVLSYVANTNVRLAMNSFYAEEYGHDELLMKALNAVGITREQLQKTIPLPQTMGMCNALAYWSHNDPLFFFTTLGILEGKDIKVDSFIETAIRIGLEPRFIAPVKAHSNINLKGEHGSLTREIFSKIPVIDEATIKRLRAQTQLFITLYDSFYTGIWDYYSTTPSLLRIIA